MNWNKFVYMTLSENTTDMELMMMAFLCTGSTQSLSFLSDHKLYDSNKETQRQDYSYSLLLLFVPFRNE